jgi:hypothetical protein
MKIKAIKYGSFMRQRGATMNTKCWDDSDTVEIDIDSLESKLSETLTSPEVDKIMPQIERFFIGLLGKE